MRKLAVTLAVVGVLGLLGVGIFHQTRYIVGEQEYVILTRFGEVRSVKDEPGRYYKAPFIDAIARYDRSPQEISTLPMLMPDREKRMGEITVEASYQIADPLQFRRTLFNHQNARRRLGDIITAQLREEVAGLSYHDLVVDNQQLNSQIVRTLEARILSSVKQTLHRSVPFGVEVLEVRMQGIELAH